MAAGSKYNFVGGYDTKDCGGLLHIANHFVSPGKKQWTWGNCDFGQAWDRNLTDEDGPYIELMTGVYTDNQPDFSWLQPYEEKSWTQYFMPYSEVGYVKNAVKDVIVGLDTNPVEGNSDKKSAALVVYTTSVQKGLTIRLEDDSRCVYLEETADISPESPWKKTVLYPAEVKDEQLILSVYFASGKTALSYQPDAPTETPLPNPAKAALPPEEVENNEQLYLTGLHLEQYRHATYNPMDYYLEALRRDSKDARCNNAVGTLLLRNGRFAQAEPYFRQAIKTLTQRNPNPYDGEAYYNLGVCLKLQNKPDDAYCAFHKAVWNAAWQDAGYFSLAQIDTARGDYAQALENVERALVRNSRNHKARQLKTALLRLTGDTQQALQFASDSLKIDGFNFGCAFERDLLTGSNQCENMHLTAHDAIEYALDYSAAGLYSCAMNVVQMYLNQTADPYPIALYAQGYFAHKNGDIPSALNYYQLAERANSDYCFPNRIEEVVILQDAIETLPRSPKANYYLGAFWYWRRQYDNALERWESSVSQDADFPTAWRNLALVYYNKKGEKQKAVLALEKAFELNPTDARVFMELDQLYKKMQYPHEFRRELMDKYKSLVDSRDDLSVEYILLTNQLGEYEKAKELLSQRRFHPWEGGEGKVTGQYIFCRIMLAKRALKEQRFEDAWRLLCELDAYPHNLGEGKLSAIEQNDVEYLKGCALEGLGRWQQAKEAFLRAAAGTNQPQQAFFYNDAQPDNIYYQGMALNKLGENVKAKERFEKLIEHGQAHFNDNCKIDYFAVSLPDLAIWEEDLNVRNRIHCWYVQALGALGLGNYPQARLCFDEVKKLDINRQIPYDL